MKITKRQLRRIIKEEKARLKKILRTSNDRHVNNRYNIVDCYLQNLEYYVRNGIWLDLFYGENQENKMGWRCDTLAYESGSPVASSLTKPLMTCDKSVDTNIVNNNAVRII